MIEGTVDSPTPMVAISGDSIRVIFILLPCKAEDSKLAAIQPAVPPPTIQMEFRGFFCIACFHSANYLSVAIMTKKRAVLLLRAFYRISILLKITD
ncbi:hypothetical protein ACSV5M_16375 [Cellvibrio sp. ARAG 10.3]|uniref:hypothetical protein n=1 Tax=Cellvibrio sp. ARAG 10.3 TaxID=3451358 RepID=UPI003F4661E1